MNVQKKKNILWSAESLLNMREKNNCSKIKFYRTTEVMYINDSKK